MWSNYFVPMKPSIEEFEKATGISIGSIKDLSTPTIPQAAMAEALTRSPDFDIVHLGSEMIPSLVSAGYLEPLDEYMQKANYKMDAVGDYANLADLRRQDLRHHHRRQHLRAPAAQGYVRGRRQ